MDELRFKPWTNKNAPGRIVVIRYQAMGDMVITLPYLNDFKRQFPDAQLYLITTAEVSAIPLSLGLFHKVIVIKGGRSAKRQFFFTLCKLPFLLWQRHEVVMDLQNNKISRVIRRVLRPKAWCAFDRFSARSAGERVALTIAGLGLGKVKLNTEFDQHVNEQILTEKLISCGWKQDHLLIVLNPAGAFDTRHWPLSNYVELASLLKKENPRFQFLVVGLKNKLHPSIDYLKSILKADLIDMTDQTDPAEAFALVRRVKLLITEDSGLMHMAWVQAVPTLAIFGSTRSDWSSPQGAWSVCLNSSDLDCGNCMLEKCIHGDNRCLTRYTPAFVYEKAIALLNR
jgi:heptosyltransferase-2